MKHTTIYLCKADSSILGTLTGIQTQTCNLKRNATDLWELTFDVNRYIDVNGKLVQSDYYDSVDDMMRLYLDSADLQVFFVIDSEPVIKGDGYQETKSVTAHSVECELCHTYLKNFKINCGTPDSQEYLACETDNEENNVFYNINPYTNLPREYISLVNYGDPQLSLLHLALQGTGWTVKEGMDADGYLDDNHYFQTIINTIKDPSGHSPERVTGHVKKKCTADKKVYAVELQKWGSSGIGFTTESAADIAIVAQSVHNTVRINDKNSTAATTPVTLPSPIALTDTDNQLYDNMQGLNEVCYQSEDENGIVLTYKNLKPGTYRIISPYQSVTTDYNETAVCNYGVQIKSVTVSEQVFGSHEKTVHVFRASDLSADADNEEIIGMCQIKKSFETSDSVYSFLMKTVSPAASVIFEFDRKHKVVGMVKADDYGEDTGVFLSMRNLMNSFDVTSTSNDNIITKLIPTGANNLGIESVNFGKEYLLNLDYFMNTRNEYGDYKFVSSELHDKYTAWKHYRESEPFSVCLEFETDKPIQGTRREVYAELTKRYNQTILDISELKNRVPNDGCIIDYTTYSLEELNTSLTAHNNALATLKTLYKNEYGVQEIGDAPDYLPVPENAVNIKDTPYWHDFYAYKEVIIPKIEEALKQCAQIGSGGKTQIDSYLYEWSLYGLDELQAKKKAWSEAANLLFHESFIASGTVDNPIEYRTADDNGWNSLLEQQKAFTSKSAFIKQLNQYLDYMAFDENRNNSLTKTQCKGIIRKCDEAIAERLAQIRQAEDRQDAYNRHRKELANAVLLDQNFGIDEKDMNVINGMIREQEFSDENIITTSLDDVITTVDMQETLYQSAMAKLHELSQPQYSFHTELDNLYALDAFKAFQKPFDIGNFIRVGLEIHEELCDNRFVKLRIISISHNPLQADENLSVEFSTMTKALNGINDLAFLLGSESGASSGGSSGAGSGTGGGTYGNNDANVQISNNMLNALLHTETFGTAVNDVILDSIQANTGNFNTLVSHSGIFGSLEEGTTAINGDCINTGSIKSNNYSSLAKTGSYFDVAKGSFESYSKNGHYIKNDGNNIVVNMGNFCIDDNGNAAFKGDISGSDGTFSGTLNGCDGNFTGSMNVNNNFIVDSKGNVTACGSLTASDAYIKGNIEATNSIISESVFINGDIEADTLKVKTTGNIAGWTFDENGFYKNNNSIGREAGAYIGNEGISISDYFIVNSDGLVTKSKKKQYTYSGSIFINKRFSHERPYTIQIKFDKVYLNDKIYLEFSGFERNHTINDTTSNYLTSKKYYIDVSNNIDDTDFTIQLDEITNILTLDISSKYLHDESSEYYSLMSITTYNHNNTDTYNDYSSSEIKEVNIKTYNDTIIRFGGEVINKSHLIIDTINNQITGGYFNLNSREFNAVDDFSFSIKNNIKNDITGSVDAIDIFKLTKDKLYHNGLSTSSSGSNLIISNGDFYQKSSSSCRYKNSIEDLTVKSQSLPMLNPKNLYEIDVVSFKYNDNYLQKTDQRYQIDIPGFIAEDIYEKYPIACNLDKDGKPEMWDINILFPAALKLIQEQHTEIETIKKQLQQLKEDNTNGTN